MAHLHAYQDGCDALPRQPLRTLTATRRPARPAATAKMLLEACLFCAWKQSLKRPRSKHAGLDAHAPTGTVWPAAISANVGQLEPGLVGLITYTLFTLYCPLCTIL